MIKSINLIGMKAESRLLLAKGQRFGRENFNLTRPVNGLYLKLLLSSLGISGKWPVLLNRLIADSCSLRSKQVNRLVDLSKQTFSSQNIQSITKSFSPVSANIQPRSKSSIRRFSRLSRLSLKSSNVTVKKVTKEKLTERAAANLIRQYKLGRSINFKFSKLVTKYTSSRSRLEHQLTSWRLVHKLIHPVSLFVEVKSKRRGGRVFSVPVPIKSVKRRHSIFIHWIKKTVKEHEASLSINQKLINELGDITLNKGKSLAQLAALEKSIRLNRVFLRKSQVRLV